MPDAVATVIDRTFSILRIREVKKLLAFVECYTQVKEWLSLLCVSGVRRRKGSVQWSMSSNRLHFTYAPSMCNASGHVRMGSCWAPRVGSGTPETDSRARFRDNLASLFEACCQCLVVEAEVMFRKTIGD